MCRPQPPLSFERLLGKVEVFEGEFGAHGGGRLIEMPDEIKEFVDTFERIGAKADSQDASRELIKKYSERYI